MRIRELFEAYNKIHMLASLLATNPEASITAVDNSITNIQTAYTKDKNNASVYVNKLEEIQEILLKSLDDENLWNYLADNVEPSALKEFYQDFVEVEQRLDKAKNQIKNDSGIFEDIVDFKGPNGQLSAMSTKRPKTKKDTAKGEVEQLFKENKK